MNITEAKEHAKKLKDTKTVLDISLDGDEIESLIEALGSADFTIKLGGNEYRFIHEADIWDIYVESIQQLVEDCYLMETDLSKIWWLEIDWEKTAKNCYADGYGHHFSGYDGSEAEAAGYYIFRTN